MAERRSAATHVLIVESFEQALRRSGLREALLGLLRLTDFRCLTLWCRDGGGEDQAVHIDREWPRDETLPAPDAVRAHGRYLRGADGRLALAAVLEPAFRNGPPPAACFAIPVLDPQGALLGTLCLHDDRAHADEVVDLELLVLIVSALARHLAEVPPDCAR